jgi:hypothetical protein
VFVPIILLDNVDGRRGSSEEVKKELDSLVSTRTD